MLYPFVLHLYKASDKVSHLILFSKLRYLSGSSESLVK